MFPFKKICVYGYFMCSICMYISVPCLYCPGKPEEVLNPLGLELQVVVCHLLGAGSSDPLKEQPASPLCIYILRA